MHHRLPLKIMLIASMTMGSMTMVGCNSAQKRPLQWWRNRSHQQTVQNVAGIDESNAEALTAAPPKLPAGIELPPEPTRPAQTQPSGATEQDETHSNGPVVFAIFGAKTN